MKKPVLVLVDDDPAVLEALQAWLRPTFEAICRTEAFPSGPALLDAVAGWTEEKRPIAVAVVDQKMPGMTGVDLLARLRADASASAGHPAAHMKAILLTGYAGLDSALRAKNAARVDRYVEKPWRNDDVIATVAGLVAAATAEDGRLSYIELVEATTPEALIAAFRLRYAVYRITPGLAPLLRENTDGVDVNGYDRRSRILLLFRHVPGARKVVGTLRVCTREDSPSLPAIRSAAARLPHAGPRIDEPAPSSFPLADELHDRAPFDRAIAELESAGARIGEVGRHAVLPDERAGATDRRQIEGTVAFFDAFGLTHAVAGVPRLHFRHYSPLGFVEIVPGAPTFYPFDAMIILAGMRDVRPPVRDRIPVLAGRLRRDSDAGGALCFCPGFPDCVPGPYLDDRFERVDLFCPRVATTVLHEAQHD